MFNKKQLGDQAEHLVAQHLTHHGFKILEQNYRKKFGEIDLIGTKDKLLVFVEVKMRSSHYFDLAQLITPAKQHRILNVASIYLANYLDQDMDCRFDVALVEMEKDTPKITYVPHAFGAE